MILGDSHGSWVPLKHKIERIDIRDCYLIHVGDVGVGFGWSFEKEFEWFQEMNEWFKDRNIEFLAIRGNHDDDTFFDGRVDLSNFKLLKDYTHLIINDELYLFVGGAISVDRSQRTLGRDYWLGEGFKLDATKIPENVDVLITHTGPSWIGPGSDNGFVVQFFSVDKLLKQELDIERGDMDKLYDLTKPKYWYLGHFHRYQTVKTSECTTVILDCNQIILHENGY